MGVGLVIMVICSDSSVNRKCESRLVGPKHVLAQGHLQPKQTSVGLGEDSRARQPRLHAFANHDNRNHCIDRDGELPALGVPERSANTINPNVQTYPASTSMHSSANIPIPLALALERKPAISMASGYTALMAPTACEYSVARIQRPKRLGLSRTLSGGKGGCFVASAIRSSFMCHPS